MTWKELHTFTTLKFLFFLVILIVQEHTCVIGFHLLALGHLLRHDSVSQRGKHAFGFHWWFLVSADQPIQPKNSTLGPL